MGGTSSHGECSAGCHFGSHGLTMRTCVVVLSMAGDGVWTICRVMVGSRFSHVLHKSLREAALWNFICQLGSPLGVGFSLRGNGATLSVRGADVRSEGYVLFERV